MAKQGTEAGAGGLAQAALEEAHAMLASRYVELEKVVEDLTLDRNVWKSRAEGLGAAAATAELRAKERAAEAPVGDQGSATGHLRAVIAAVNDRERGGNILDCAKTLQAAQRWLNEQAPA